MNYNLTGKGVFVFSDPAGSNSSLALVQLMQQQHCLTDFKIFTSSSGYTPEGNNLPVERMDFSTLKINNFLDQFAPDFLFTGTSTNDYEHNWRRLAIRKNIKTMAFIDHWTNYRERFSFNNNLFIPDEIWVIDKIAKAEAIEAGLPADRIIVSGNPYYETIRNYKPEISKSEFFRSISLDINKRTILFISDDIKRSFPQDEQGNCTLGFDEYTTLKDILTSLKSLGKEIDFAKYQLVIKLHPRSKMGKFDQLIKDHAPAPMNVVCIRDCDPLAINYYSDFVMGMFSNMVIEAILMNKKLLRIQINEKTDPLLSFKVPSNNIPKITLKDNLVNTLYILLEL